MHQQLLAAEDAIRANKLEVAVSIYEEMLAGGKQATGLLLRQLVPLYVQTRQLIKALEAAQALVYFAPTAESYMVLSSAQEKLGLNDAALSSVHRTLQLNPEDRSAVETRLYLLASRYSPMDYYEEAVRCAPECPPPKPLSSRPSAPLKVGYVSGDFKAHVMDRLIEPLLKYSSLDVTCYDNTIKQDEVSTRLRTYPARWKYIYGLSAEAVAQQVVDDKIDVLVDLAGLTAGNRLDVFNLRPAPIQVTMLGYLPTTGYRCFDWRIADVEQQYQYSEPLWSMESAAAPLPLCSQLPITPLPALRNGFITFGYVNGLRKLTSAFIEQAVSVLKAVPNSRLVVMCLGASDEDTATSVLRRFGNVQDRVMLTESCGGAAFCRLFAEIDIALDPFPYGGCITSYDTLYHGVPILSDPSDRRLNADARRLQQQALGRVFPYSCVGALADDLGYLGSLRENLRPALSRILAGQPELWVGQVEDTFKVMVDAKKLRMAA